jgi:TRC40/GET3/ArsA family transport-energizing ATPase
MAGPADLFDRELLVFVGKGGVGKTTTSAAVALRLAREGRKTLLVTVDPAKRLADALGIEIGHRLTKIKPNLHAMMLDPEKVIEEYLRENYPDENLIDHPFYKYVSNYMPGINEILAIGKLIEFRQEKDFDTIVIDTAPTGHALSFLTTPLKVRDLFQENTLLRWAIKGYGLYQKFSKGGRALGKIFKSGTKDLPEAPDVDFEKLFGQISQHVGSIQELLSDHERTTLVIVTLAEKLPIEETADLHEYIHKQLKIKIGYIAVNRVQPDVFGEMDKDLKRLSKDHEAQRDIGNHLSQRGYNKSLFAALMTSAEFDEVRRQLNLDNIALLQKKLPGVPKILLPLHKEEVSGLKGLELFEEEFFKSLARTVHAEAR